MGKAKGSVARSTWNSAWRTELTLLGVLAVAGVAASYLSVTIPYAEVYIEGRWIFGFMGFALLNHWWTALLLAVILSLSRLGSHPVWVLLAGNMLYAAPTLFVIRVLHKRALDRLRTSPWYGVAWFPLILGCYQVFTTPAVWGFLAYLNRQPIGPNILTSWREQPFLVESFLVGIISALAMQAMRDNMALRERQKAHQESHERLLLALRNARMGAWEWDVARNQVEYYGEYTSIFGKSGEAVGNILKEFQESRNPDDQEQSNRIFRRALETGADFDDTYRATWPDGSIQWIHAHGKPSCDAQGRVQRVVGTVRNVTERKQAEEERAHLNAQIRDQAQQMAHVLAAVPAGILLLDAEGRVLQANPTAQKDLPILQGIAVGDALTNLGDHSLNELLTTPPTRGLWHEVHWEKRIYEAITRPVERGLEPGHWVLVIEDVTLEREIRAQLQQQEQLAVVGQLAAGIAHDFNNLMAIMSLYTQMTLKSAALSSQERERLGIILQQIQRATALIQQILDFSRRAVLERQIINLVSFLDGIVKLLARTIPENIKIVLTYGKGDYTVNADPTRLQQAFMNLAINARDAMPSGGELTIALSRTRDINTIKETTSDPIEEGPWVRIMVTDDGSGIPPDALPHIFEPFFTTKAVGKGMGLGLAQVYGIVKHHEGHITVTSSPDVGTTFTIYLPASSAQPVATASESRSLIYGQGETILVVEDDHFVRQALVESLVSLNYQVLEAGEGQEALAILEQLAADPTERGPEVALILSDFVMPKMGGQALLHAMKQRGLKTPLVILSGHPMESELQALQAQGLAGWMLKPPDIEKLSTLLAQVLSKKEP